MQFALGQIDVQIGDVQQIGTNESPSHVRATHDEFDISKGRTQHSEMRNPCDLGTGITPDAGDHQESIGIGLEPEFHRFGNRTRHEIELRAGIENEPLISAIDLDERRRLLALHLHRHRAEIHNLAIIGKGARSPNQSDRRHSPADTASTPPHHRLPV